MRPLSDALLTDLYQLTMLQSYLDHGMDGTAVFEFFVRKMPENRNFLVAAGLEQVVEYLEHLSFSQTDLEWLDHAGQANDSLLNYLRDFRFSGSLEAMPEGSVFFANEPILRVVAPIRQAQIVESRLINLLHFQTLIASKAVRSVIVAPDKLLVDFGLRRAHGAEAGLLAARAAYLAGFGGTATVEAGARFGIPIFGTMAHSFVQAHEDESLAFEHFASSHPGNVVLLIDTYDTEEGARKVVELASRLRLEGIHVKGVRIDSGDLEALAHSVRCILDDGGCPEITIFASGNLDEYILEEFTARQAPIDGYGVGTRLDTSADQSYLDCAYKLQEYAGIPCRKRSRGKATWPGRKQVFRQEDKEGLFQFDVLTLESDTCTGRPLLEPVMENGHRLGPLPSLDEIQARLRLELERLPPSLLGLREPAGYEAHVSKALRQLAESTDRAVNKMQGDS